MLRRKRAALDELTYLFRQAQEAQRAQHLLGRAIDPRGDGVEAQAELGHEAPIGARLVERREMGIAEIFRDELERLLRCR